MATQPVQQGLPLFYKDLVPLNSNEHANYKSRSVDNANFMQGQHAIPLTVEEFVSAANKATDVYSFSVDREISSDAVFRRKRD